MLSPSTEEDHKEEETIGRTAVLEREEKNRNKRISSTLRKFIRDLFSLDILRKISDQHLKEKIISEL